MFRQFFAAAGLVVLCWILAACSPSSALPNTGSSDKIQNTPNQTQTAAASTLYAAAYNLFRETPGVQTPSPSPVVKGTQVGTATPIPQNIPPVKYTLGYISGVVWRDVCFREGKDRQSTNVPSSGCVPTGQGNYQANGYREPLEPVISDVKISLGAGACPASQTLATAWTDVNGIYSFGGLAAASYCVVMNPQDPENSQRLSTGNLSFPGPGMTSQTVTIQSGESRTDVNFGWDNGLELASGGGTAIAMGNTPAPTKPQPSPTASLAPTKTATAPPIPTSTPTQTPTPTAQVRAQAQNPMNTVTVTAPASTTVPGTAQVAEPCSNLASFVSDVTIPDGTLISPGLSFVKTWRIRNDGTCTWKPGEYSLVPTGGDWQGGPDQTPIQQEVRPGQTVDVSINLVSPAVTGAFTKFWMLREAQNGQLLGVGPDGKGPLYTHILVAAPGGEVGLSELPEQTATVSTQALPQNTQVPPNRGQAVSAGSFTRVQFEPGTTSSAQTGALKPGESAAYTFWVGRGYTIIATLRADDPDVRMDFFSRDGSPFQVSPQPDGSVRLMDLPSSQEYIVKVSAGSHAATYTLTLEIPGAISTDLSGAIKTYGGEITGGRRAVYLIKGKAGQELNLSVSTPGPALLLSVVGFQDHQILVSPDNSPLSAWKGTLPTTQDYLISLIPSVDSTSYALDVAQK